MDKAIKKGYEIMGVFIQIRPVWVGDRETRQKILNIDSLGLKIDILYFLALSPTLLKKFKSCHRHR